MNTKFLPLIILFLVLVFGGIAVFSNQNAVPQLSQQINNEENIQESTQSADITIPCSGEVTPVLTEGPYYTPNSPEKTTF